LDFEGNALGHPVARAVSREALDDNFGADGLDKEGRVESLLRNRSRIEMMARAKYLSWPIEEPGAVLIKTMDVPILAKGIQAAWPRTFGRFLQDSLGGAQVPHTRRLRRCAFGGLEPLDG
jgi:hypothetical protein